MMKADKPNPNYNPKKLIFLVSQGRKDINRELIFFYFCGLELNNKHNIFMLI